MQSDHLEHNNQLCTCNWLLYLAVYTYSRAHGAGVENCLELVVVVVVIQAVTAFMSAVMTSSLQHGHGGGQTVTPMQFHAAAQCALQGAASSMQQSSWVPANSSLSQLEASSWTKDQVIQRHDRTSPTNHKNNMHSTRHHVEQQNSSYRPESACSSDDLHQLADHALDQDFRQFAPSLENQQSDLLVEVADINFNLHKVKNTSSHEILTISTTQLDPELENIVADHLDFHLYKIMCDGLVQQLVLTGLQSDLICISCVAV